MPTGTILVEAPEEAAAGVVLYPRVSCADQKADLHRQLERLGWTVVLRSSAHGAIVAEHRGRLARFGCEDSAPSLAATGRRLVVVEPEEVQDDLVPDVIDVPTRMCAALWSSVARQRAEKALQAASAR